MRTKYAIVNIKDARKAGIDVSTLRKVGNKVIITEAQGACIEGLKYLTREEVINKIQEDK